MSQSEMLSTLTTQLNAVDIRESNSSPRQPSPQQPPTRTAPARRSSWLTEVGADTRRHSTSAGNVLKPVSPQLGFGPNRSQSFSVGPRQPDQAVNTESASQKRFSTAFTTVSESAIEDEYDPSIHSNSSQSNSVAESPLRVSRRSFDQQTPRSTLPTSLLSPPNEASEYTGINHASPQLSHRSDELNMGLLYYIVEFKLYRSEVYMFDQNYGVDIRPGNVVIVEADRGIDLGKVKSVTKTYSEALVVLAEAQRAHHDELLSFCRLSRVDRHFHPPALNGLEKAREDEARGIQPVCRQILRKPVDSEIEKLKEKEHQEAKARRHAHNEAAKLGFNIEILDAEFQFDFEKLTISFYAETYIHFNNLVNQLYKQYKTRIWMSNICQSANSQHLAGMAGGRNAPRGPQAMNPISPRQGPGQRYSSMPQMELTNSPGPPYYDQYGQRVPVDPPPTPPGKILYDWGAQAPSRAFDYQRAIGLGPPESRVAVQPETRYQAYPRTSMSPSQQLPQFAQRDGYRPLNPNPGIPLNEYERKIAQRHQERLPPASGMPSMLLTEPVQYPLVQRSPMPWNPPGANAPRRR